MPIVLPDDLAASLLKAIADTNAETLSPSFGDLRQHLVSVLSSTPASQTQQSHAVPSATSSAHDSGSRTFATQNTWIPSLRPQPQAIDPPPFQAAQYTRQPRLRASSVPLGIPWSWKGDISSWAYNGAHPYFSVSMTYLPCYTNQLFKRLFSPPRQKHPPTISAQVPLRAHLLCKGVHPITLVYYLPSATTPTTTWNTHGFRVPLLRVL
ncbi:hypothetical protein C8R45DRAFT_478816 [Mycena sanguinolenta]|nr:hypothetical protein C8R45DRAFT_478816 [Mycena sanguinolenta]